MSILQMAMVWGCALNPTQTLVLLELADHARDDGTHVHPSVEHIAWKTNLSRATVQRTLRSLEHAGIIEATALSRGGRGLSTRYRLHLENAPQKPPWRDPLPPHDEAVTDEKGPHDEAVTRRDEAKPPHSEAVGAKPPHSVPKPPHHEQKPPHSVPKPPHSEARNINNHQEKHHRETVRARACEEPPEPSPREIYFRQAWRATQERLRATLTPAGYDNWIAPVRIEEDPEIPGAARLVTPTSAGAQVLRARIRGDLETAWRAVTRAHPCPVPEVIGPPARPTPLRLAEVGT